jgi:hypothetical protein
MPVELEMVKQVEKYDYQAGLLQQPEQYAPN